MEEIEVPTEHLHEDIHHQAEHSGEKWITWVALCSALLAVLAAVTALMAGHHANEAMIEQMQASDNWAHYQAKSIKAAILTEKSDLLEAAGKSLSEADRDKIAEYKKDQEEISEKAKEKEQASASHLRHHVILARGVTMFQVAIAISAIAALTKRRHFFLVGLCFSLVGIFFLIQGLLLKT